MNYTLLIYQTPADFAARTDPDKRAAFWGAFMPYMHELQAAGVVVASAGLEPPETATTLNLKQAPPQVQDGPYADTREQLGGLFVIDVPDLETALSWAGRCPPSTATHLEVRPNLQPTV